MDDSSIIPELLALYGPVVAVTVVVGVFLVVPTLRDWLGRRFDRLNAKHAIQLELNKDYFNRRLEVYLAMWRLTMTAIRALFGAASRTSPSNWGEARQTVADLKNFFWDNRPLLSGNVFSVVNDVDDVLKELGHLGQATGVDHDDWTTLNRQVKGIQQRLLAAMAADLQSYGVPGLVENLASAPGPTRSHSDLDAAAGRLVAWIASLQGKLPYAGVSYVLKNFRSPAGVTAQAAFDHAKANGHIIVTRIRDGDTEVAAVEVNRSHPDVHALIGGTPRPQALPHH